MSEQRALDNEIDPAEVDYIADDLRPLAYPVAAIYPDPNNANTHKPEGLREIAASLRKFKQRTPVVVNLRNNTILKGNGTYTAATQLLGWDYVAAIFVDDDPLTATGYSIADNRVAELSVFDPATLNRLLESLDEPTEIPGIDTDYLDELAGMIADLTSGADGGVGGQATEAARQSLAERFVVPPFSVLDARQGYWQDRKRSWVNLGLQSELGRGADVAPGGGLLPAASLGADGTTQRGDGTGRPILYQDSQSRLNEIMGNDGYQTGASVFDPVVCELVYRWFCPQGGRVLDPFAGGSVRGVVAGMLGREYIGIELSERQVLANREQVEALFAEQAAAEEPESDTVTVKVSAAMARLRFNGCEPDYIANVCHGACERSTSSPTGTMITIHDSEIKRIEELGGVVIDNMLQPRTHGVCPFQEEGYLCSLHFTPDKPFGCIASPFTLNKNNTLIVRNRYKLLKCYEAGRKLPAYKAFTASLVLLFGQEEADKIVAHFDAGGGDYFALMARKTQRMLLENDRAKKGPIEDSPEPVAPVYHVGDSLQLLEQRFERMDLVFSCPPYGNLEQYTDDPADISNMDYPQFLEAYRAIIAKACGKLDNHRFAAIVVGDFRDSQGNYQNFVSDTIAAFLDAGLQLYNEAILVTAIGSLPIRAGRQFSASRKLGKTHQQLLVFVKGDPRLATDACGEVLVELPDDLQEGGL